MEKQQFTRRQHYVPQYSIRPFEIECGKCLVMKDVHASPTIELQATADTFQKVDLYETKTPHGTYIQHNQLEKNFSYFEDRVAKQYRKFVTMMGRSDALAVYQSLIRRKTNEWPVIESAILEHIALTLIRSPQAKIIIEKSTFPNFLKPTLYRQLIFGTSNAVGLAKSMLVGEELEIALNFLKLDLEDAAKVLVEKLMSNYQLRIYTTPKNIKFVLSDNPIIVNKFETVDYLLPITPTTCVGCRKLMNRNGKIFLDEGFFSLTFEDVQRINSYSIENAADSVIILSEADVPLAKRKKMGE